MDAEREPRRLRQTRSRRPAPRRARQSLWIVALSLACAHPPATIEVQPAVAKESLSAALLRVEVRDERRFQNVRKQTSVQSLRGVDPNDPARVARVVGRRRATGNGLLLGNLMLAEDQSVNALAGAAIVAGFRRAGLPIVQLPNPGGSDSPPIRASIRRFWIDMQTARGPGVSYRFNAEIWISAPVPPFEDGMWVCSEKLAIAGGPSNATAARSVEGGLAQLANGLASRLVWKRGAIDCTLPAGPLPPD